MKEIIATTQTACILFKLVCVDFGFFSGGKSLEGMNE